MSVLTELLRRKAPRSGKEMPLYYRRALATSETVLAVYFLLTCALFSWANRRPEWVPALMCAAMVGCRAAIGRVNSRLCVYAFGLLTLVWCAWCTHVAGWSSGAQQLLIPALMLCFFNIYEPVWAKLVTFLVVFAYRMALFAYAMQRPGIYALSQVEVVLCQTMNSLALFAILGECFVVFSSSVQETERQLLINNQELHREAGTDPLTQLPNRRAMLDAIEAFRRDAPEEPFGVAIADIDFFKKVNDTYGHHCGDYTLKELSALFLRMAEGRYKVCRWGGEEFCFFMPRMNLDEAGSAMHDLNREVRKMPLKFGDIAFNISITIGVEENDFQSSLEAILDKADRKLYMGKVGGRDRVVI